MQKAQAAGVLFSHRALFGDHRNISLRADLHIAAHSAFLHLTHSSRQEALESTMQKQYNVKLHQNSPWSVLEERQSEVTALIDVGRQTFILPA